MKLINIQKKYSNGNCIEVFYIDETGKKIEVELFELRPSYCLNSKKKSIQWGINWGGYGTMNPEFANAYAMLITVASTEAVKNNYLNK